jgi:hypothetical protein
MFNIISGMRYETVTILTRPLSIREASEDTTYMEILELEETETRKLKKKYAINLSNGSRIICTRKK